MPDAVQVNLYILDEIDLAALVHHGQCPEGARQDRPQGIPPRKKHHLDRSLARAPQVAAPVENQGVLEAPFPNLQPPAGDAKIGVDLVVSSNKAGVQSLERRPNSLLVVQPCLEFEVEAFHIVKA